MCEKVKTHIVYTRPNFEQVNRDSKGMSSRYGKNFLNHRTVTFLIFVKNCLVVSISGPSSA